MERSLSPAESPSSDLVALFLAAWPEPHPQSTELAVALDCALLAAEKTWSDVVVDRLGFARHLATRVDVRQPPTEALAALRVSDLFLAAACLAGSRVAAEHLERSYLVGLRPLLGRLDPTPAFGDAVLQALRHELLPVALAGDGAEGRLAEFRGRGPLIGWLEVAALRLGLARNGSTTSVRDPDDLVAAAMARDPLLVRLAASAGSQAPSLLRQTVAEAFAALEPEDRNLLRWHVVERISLRKLSLIRGTSLGGITRAHEVARGRLQESLRRLLPARFEISSDELDPITSAVLHPAALTMATVGLRH